MLRMMGLAAGTLALGLTALYALHFGTSSHRVLNQFESLAHGEYFHVVAEPLHVRPGTDARATGIAGRLARAGLRRVRDEPAAGQYRAAAEAIEYRRVDDADNPVRLDLAADVVSSVTIHGEYADAVTLPPEHLTSFLTSMHERRAPITYADIPPQLVTAVLAAEDRRFFEHPGVDWRGIVRALARNATHGRVVEGGSTITQQTVKIILNRTRRELPAKIDEALLALLVERRFTKQDILTVYLNNVYLGHEGPFDIHGAAEGARYFFGASLVDLTDKQCYELAAAIRAPNTASPRRHRERLADYAKAIAKAAPDVKQEDAKHRKASADWDGPDDDAAPVALETAASTADRIDFDEAQMAYFFDVLDKEWKSLQAEHRIEPPATIVACVDPILQLRAAQALERGLVAAAKRDSRSKSKTALQGAVVSLDPRDGALRAVVGGSDYAEAPFNRATSISRQVGSTFKPFVYLAAMGGLDDGPIVTQSTLLPDTLRTYQVGDQEWAPANFDGEFRGTVTVREALEHSINTATVALGMDVGIGRVASLAERLGVADKIPRNPSICLGAVETSPLRLATAYACFANGGFTVTPHALSEVWIGDRGIRAERPAATRVASAEGTYLVTDMLVGVLRFGTGASSSRLGFNHLAAGKTGTSDKARDTWFVGYTPELVSAVWMGHDDDSPTKLSGASAALPVWCGEMAAWLGQGWDATFKAPDGITFRSIDPLTGQIANSTCPDVEPAAYLADTGPQDYCTLHSPSFGDRFDRIFGQNEAKPDPGVQPPPPTGFWARLRGKLKI
jgi:penicillin-binding protein 1B